VRPDGSPWISAAQVGGEIGAYGANRHGDADSQMLSYQANGIGVAVESVESEVPVVVLRHEPVPDTAGAGYNRGGASMLRDTLWLSDAQHHLMSLRYKRAPGFGVYGGGDGATGGIWLTNETGEEIHVAGMDGGVYRYPYRVPFWETQSGTRLRYVTAGGGGWGNPLEREPARVLRDVRDGYVTIEGAARDYGVVVTGDPERDPELISVDVEATERLRSAR
jgi:N-methylhydantoinase B